VGDCFSALHDPGVLLSAQGVTLFSLSLPQTKTATYTHSNRTQHSKSQTVAVVLRSQVAAPGVILSWRQLSACLQPVLQSQSPANPPIGPSRPDAAHEETNTVHKTSITHSELDERLSNLAESMDSYDSSVTGLAQKYDTGRVELEITKPTAWRRERAPGERSAANSIEEQFRFEVALILTQSREDEVLLARRIDFSRRLLDISLERAGLDFSDLSRPRSGSGLDSNLDRAGFPADLLRRWRELHALRKELVERNLYLVLINVERYAHTRVSRMDLMQEGSSVLFRAVDGFDWRRGWLFRTYAVHWLNQAFRSFLYNFGNTVRVPVYLQKAMKHVNEAMGRLGGQSTTAEEISKETDIAQNVVESAIGASRLTRSIDSELSHDSEGALRDLLAIDEASDGPYDPEMEDFSLQDGVDMALRRLSPREHFVIGLRFGLDGQLEHTLAEIAVRLGVSLERVRQIQVRAISKMNTPKLRKAIDPFLV